MEMNPVKPRAAQGGLFVPAAPEPVKLELTLARIRAIVGEGRVGSPELLDTHRPDAFRMVDARQAAVASARQTRPDGGVRRPHPGLPHFPPSPRRPRGARFRPARLRRRPGHSRQSAGTGRALAHLRRLVDRATRGRATNGISRFATARSTASIASPAAGSWKGAMTSAQLCKYV